MHKSDWLTFEEILLSANRERGRENNSLGGSRVFMFRLFLWFKYDILVHRWTVATVPVSPMNRCLCAVLATVSSSLILSISVCVCVCVCGALCRQIVDDMPHSVPSPARTAPIRPTPLAIGQFKQLWDSTRTHNGRPAPSNARPTSHYIKALYTQLAPRRTLLALSSGDVEYTDA